MNKCKDPISDNVKIALVHRAIHPDLRPDVAYQPDGRPWATYKDFRTNLNSVASHFDERHNLGRHFSQRSPSRQTRFNKRHGTGNGNGNGNGNSYGNGNGYKPRHNGQGNHGPRQSPFKPRFNNHKSNGNGMKCWGCGKFGHVQANCPNAAQVSDIELLSPVKCSNRFVVLATMPEAVEPVELRKDMLLIASQMLSCWLVTEHWWQTRHGICLIRYLGQARIHMSLTFLALNMLIWVQRLLLLLLPLLQKTT
jgi:hypothetical protein